MVWTRRNASDTAGPEAQSLQRKQRLRKQRFFMALCTYAFLLMVIAMATQIGPSHISTAQWVVIIGGALAGNLLFFFLFSTNANLHFSDPSLTREQIVYSAMWGAVVLYSLPKVRPIVLMCFLPAFSFGMLRLNRRQYLNVVAMILGLYAVTLTLSYLLDRQAFNAQYELFLFAIFGMILVWFAVFGGFMSDLRERLCEQNREIQKAHKLVTIEINERKHSQIEKDTLIAELQEAARRVKTLRGLLPICAACKKIRDDKGYWKQIEIYIADHSEADFSHSICPECRKKLYPNL